MQSTPLTFDTKEFLRPLLFGLPEEDLDLLAQKVVMRRFETEAVICREGEPGEHVYIVVDGWVGIYKRVDDRTERHIHTGGPGEFFGEIAVLREGARSATVRATEPTTLLEIDKDTFLSILGRSPSLGIRFLMHATTRWMDSDRQSIEALQRANQELTGALQRLERLDRTKTDFIQVSAHELRTPLAALLGYTQMMEKHTTVQDDPELRMLMNGILTSTQRLHRVFNSILDASRVMNEGLKIYRSPVSIPVIFHGILTDYATVIDERKLTVEMSGLQGLPFLSAAPDLLTKAFHYLVNNAIKYTPDGGTITITVKTLDDTEQGAAIEVAIRDTGIGIAPEDLDLIFEKFYRTGQVALHSSGATNFRGGGPGLGLTIARGVIEAHGGRIWAESPGYSEAECPGSTFYVRLPITAQASVTS
ncbi:MAG: cyclic nucleotide-binding domain-containing protein [Chloroflexi bacterium]|nr:cyclic nucleotide-binding domain-containing protein [Chloroflexota bacterium]